MLRIRLSSSWVIMFAIVAVGVFIGQSFFERQAMKRTIMLMARSFQIGAAPNPALFTDDAVFRFENLESPYDAALSVFVQRVPQHHAFGDVYVQEIEMVSRSIASVKTTSWFSIGGSSYEASGIVVLKKAGLFRWKIASVSSGFPAFRELFFDITSVT